MASQKFLVICLRRLGDVLLSTALIRSLRQSRPDAIVDALVYGPTAAILEGNPDLRRVHLWPQRRGDRWRLLCELFRAYDASCAVTPSDRAQFLAWWAAPRRAITVQAGFPRRWVPARRVLCEPDRRHTVDQNLALARALAVPAVPDLVPPQTADTRRLAGLLGDDWPAQAWAVLHPVPMFPYKAWTTAGWQALIEALLARGLRVVLSGGPAAAERQAVAALAGAGGRPDRVIDVAGQLSLAELAGLLRVARLYVGPDTSITHLAAACATPTLALFGPSSPVAWGPWPQGHGRRRDGDRADGGPAAGLGAGSPWRMRAAAQGEGSVLILQGARERRPGCIPCRLEGCEQRLDSRSDCLDGLTPAQVISAAEILLARA